MESFEDILRKPMAQQHTRFAIDSWNDILERIVEHGKQSGMTSNPFRGMSQKLLDNPKLFFKHWEKVFICFESKSLGDTLAWLPYCEEFAKKYRCEVIVSTFMNHLFEKSYPELKFVGRGIVVENIAGMFELGWFYDKKKEPEHPVTIPLQKAATNILNLEYSEIIPRLDFEPKERPVEGDYVCISIHSTAKLKYWDYWQELVDWLVGQGYNVVEVSKEASDLNNLTEIKDKSIPSVMNYLHHAKFYIGLSSGISWLAWAMRKTVFMIANFSTKDHEFQTDCIRITDESVCHGCWNNPMHRFNKGDWGWCPENEVCVCTESTARY